MTPACPDVRPRLFAYHLGAGDLGLRDDIDAHLTGCPECLRAFLAHKRTCEDGGAFDERPSPALRQRLRTVVAARRRVPRAPKVVWVMAVAALALAVLGAMYVIRAPLAPLSRPAEAPGLVDAPSTQAASNLL